LPDSPLADTLKAFPLSLDPEIFRVGKGCNEIEIGKEGT
jgi:hypothetical protein